MSESPLSQIVSESENEIISDQLESDQMSVLKQILHSSRKLNETAQRMIQRVNPTRTTIPLFIAGTGAVGGTLIEQIAELDSDYTLEIIGACNSTNFIWNEEGIPPGELVTCLEQADQTDWNRILSKLSKYATGKLIFVDATGDAEVARLYPSIMKSDIHIATPSKRANTFEQEFYEHLQEISQAENVEFRYEPTVGAGLPVLSTITGLLQTGDEIDEISGVASGTMTYLFNKLEEGIAFSQAVKKARELGYAEPDPRDDLSGEDVARKFLTLSRTIGLKVERSELEIQSLVPEHLISVDRETFLNEFSEVDEYWKTEVEQAKERNETLRYVGKLTNHDISVGIQSVPIDSPIGRLSGTDNLFQISTKRYSNTPIVIQGPGAGKEVTAAGVLADVLKIAQKITSKH